MSYCVIKGKMCDWTTADGYCSVSVCKDTLNGIKYVPFSKLKEYMADNNEDSVLDFIHRRFTKDCDWMSGNCYWFAKILCDRFPFLELYYDQIPGHFYAVDVINSLAYDFEGEHPLSKTARCFSCLEKEDPLLYERLITNCAS